MNRLIISIGSNTADRDIRMAAALKWLDGMFYISSRSEIYSTPEYSGRFDPYLNCVVEAVTDITPHESISSIFKEYERTQGRTAQSKSTGQIPIDLDLVKFNSITLRPKEFNREYFLIGYRQLRELTDC